MSYGTRCEDCVICTECGDIAYCLSTPGDEWPCPHWPLYCQMCALEFCEDCQEEAETAMWEGGVYSPHADPLYRPERKTADDKPRRLETFDPIRNAYREDS